MFFVVKQCKTDVVGSQCPPNTSCVQQQNQTVDGFCKCLPGYSYNDKLTSDENYCVVAVATVTVPSTSTVAITTTTSTTTTPKPKITIVTTMSTKKSVNEKTTVKIITTTTSPLNSSSTTISPLPTDDNSVQKTKVPVESEHLLSGALLPFLVVVIFIGGVFLIRKHNVLERAHTYVSNRNWRIPGTSRPNYTNDFDEFDDPLLI